ncbi:MAG: FHA domain-containing protein, partial [Methanoregula sp.]|nr:FHA domain-containing protein [Methanoregula sp.]
GKTFLLKHDVISIGRNDPENVASFRPDVDVVLSDGYTAVTRVSRPHAKFIRDKGTWHIEDSGSTGGTQLNNHKLETNVRTPLHDGDLIELAKGVSGVRFLVIIPGNP